MLASTVKFSTYGRKREPHSCSEPAISVRDEAWSIRPKLQDPTACLGRGDNSARFHSCLVAGCTDARMPTRLNGQCSTFRCLLRPSTIGSEPQRMEQANLLTRLLRKEVIQPHLPVRLPCYDLVLIASPTFDGSLHKGWATGFGCYRLS
jgi:hypothetical protein